MLNQFTTLAQLPVSDINSPPQQVCTAPTALDHVSRNVFPAPSNKRVLQSPILVRNFQRWFCAEDRHICPGTLR